MHRKDFKILLVDDAANNVFLLREILEQPNRVFFTAGSGKVALELIADISDIHLVIIDVQMPVLDGFELARILKSDPKTAGIPIIFISGVNKKHNDIIEGFEKGGVDYLLKPLDVDITRAKVNVFEEMHYYLEFLTESIDEKNKENERLSRYAYVIAHDLRAPLAGISSMLDILKSNKKLFENEDFREFFPLISQSTQNLMDMTRTVLTYSKSSENSQKAEEVNVKELVTILFRFLLPPKNIQCNVSDNMPMIYTERVKLMQVFQNLIGNAIKFTDKPVGEVNIGCDDAGSFCRFYVQDNGVGIPIDKQSIIFNKFTTGNHEKSETGIGLDIVKMLVEQQGGTVSVSSTPGTGSCFYFTWPKAPLNN